MDTFRIIEKKIPSTFLTALSDGIFLKSFSEILIKRLIGESGRERTEINIGGWSQASPKLGCGMDGKHVCWCSRRFVCVDLNKGRLISHSVYETKVLLKTFRRRFIA